MLRERNIAVYFEVEKINTLKDGEFLLTILSSVAQQEVENTSAYVKKGLKMKMKRGELVGFQGCLGYDYDVVTKSLSINEEGAETVRYIFDRYVAGAGSTMIARELNEQGMLCTDHKDVLEEFIKRVEKTLSEDSIEDKIEKLNRSVYNIQYKRKKLLESYLEGVVAKDIYEETDVGYEKKLSEAKAQLSMLEQQYDNEGSLQRRLADFRKALSKNQILEEFDRGIFESIIEKVIVGGYDENGEKDPYKIIFIYKTGFKNEIGNAKERFGKKSKAVEKAKEMCSHIADEVKDVCSYASDNTCGDSLFAVEETLILCGVAGFFERYVPVSLAGIYENLE